MTTTARHILVGALVLVLVLQSIVLIRTAGARRELARLRAEIKMWSACEKIGPGMLSDDAISILGVPARKITGMQGEVHMLYHVTPSWLPDNDLHISGCRVITTNGVVAECSLATAIRSR